MFTGGACWGLGKLRYIQVTVYVHVRISKRTVHTVLARVSRPLVLSHTPPPPPHHPFDRISIKPPPLKNKGIYIGKATPFRVIYLFAH